MAYENKGKASPYFCQKENCPTHIPEFFSSNKLDDKIFTTILATVSVMADIFMCALKMLTGAKFNVWHTFIENK